MAKKKQSVASAEQQLLRELKELTSRQFVYEDGWHGMVPYSGTLGEWQTGPPERFADLHWRDQVDILREFIHWTHYPEHAWDDEYKIRDNIAAGKPPEVWLEGTSLRQSFQHLAQGKTPPPVQREPPEIRQEDVAELLFGQDHPSPAPAPEKGNDLQNVGQVATADHSTGGQVFEDIDGSHRTWETLSAESKLQLLQTHETIEWTKTQLESFSDEFERLAVHARAEKAGRPL